MQCYLMTMKEKHAHVLEFFPISLLNIFHQPAGLEWPLEFDKVLKPIKSSDMRKELYKKLQK